MVYPGNTELSGQAQERVVSAFRQVITKLQDGRREEALIGLEFVLRLDPGFSPAVNLQQQLSSGSSEIDLSEIIGQLQAPTTEDINELLVEAIEDFEQRNFVAAKEKVEQVLYDLPGNQDGRRLLAQIDDALKVEGQVGQFLVQAREALDKNDPQEASNFVLMAQALDPHHLGIADALRSIEERSGGPPPESGQPAAELPPEPAAAEDQDFAVSFETMAEPAPDFATAFAQSDADAGGPADTIFAPAEDTGDGIAATEGDFMPPETVVDEGSGDFFTAEEFSGSAPAFEDGFSIPEAASEESDSLSLDDSFGIPEPGGADSASDWPQDQAAADYGPGPEAGGDESLFSVDGSDISDLFEEAPPSAAVAQAPGAPEQEDDATLISGLSERGDEAMEQDDIHGAIHLWSQIYLIDPSHPEAGQRIAAARARLAEIDRQVAKLVFDAQDAALSGDADRARSLVGEALAVQPQNVPAYELRERLTESPGAAPVTAQPELPDLEEDLFQEEPDEIVDLDLMTLPDTPEEPAASKRPRRRGVPWRTVLIGLAAVAIVLVGVMLGKRMLSGDRVDDQSANINRMLIQSQQLFSQGQTDEAILLLRDFLSEFNGSDLDRSRIMRRIEKYEEELAGPTPTPVPTSVNAAEEMLARGLWLSAFGHAVTGLQSNPGDSKLLMLRDRVVEQEPRVPALHSALQRNDFLAAVSMSDQLVHDHPQQPEFAQELRRSLFNAALKELHGYNLTSAESYLLRLAELEPADQEVLRVLRFVEKYKTRPVDPRLRIFIQSLSAR